MATSYEEYRATKTEAAMEFQDFAMDCLLKYLGFLVQQYVSKPYQYKVGESRTGIEFKFDMKRAETGNLWIETGEKARPRDGDYWPSGIDKGDNTWLYVIGDYEVIYVFSVKTLRRYRDWGASKVRENNGGTSTGFLMPESDAAKYADTVIYPKPEDRIV